MSAIIEAAGNVVTGGWLGLAGSFFTKGLSLFEGYQNRKHELAVLKIQGESKEASDRWAAFTASQNAAAAEVSVGASPWAINLRITTRPILTYALCGIWGITSLLVVCMDKVPAEAVAANDALGMLAGAAVSWWFGSRQLEKITTAKK